MDNLVLHMRNRSLV